MKKRSAWFLSLALTAIGWTQTGSSPETPEQRAAALVSRMTLEEKVSQMQNTAPAIPRLQIPAYDWWNEALHGVARAGSPPYFRKRSASPQPGTPIWNTGSPTLSRPKRAPNITTLFATIIIGVITGSLSGPPTSTSFAIRAGAAARRPTERIPISPLRWRSHSSTACRGTIRITSRPSQPLNISRCIAGRRCRATTSTRSVSQQDLDDTYLNAFHATLAEGGAVFRHVRLQSRRRSPGLRERFPARRYAARQMEVSRLRSQRLWRYR